MGIMGIIGWLVFGLIVGAIARFIMPGSQHMGWLMTIVLGIVGSIVGGFLGSLIFGGGGERLPVGGWISSILGALLVLFIYSRVAASGKM